MFPVIDVSDDASELPEQLGSKYKFWYANQTHMFKLGREGTGENFSEKIACELCRLLGLPHAYYELALWRGKQGTITVNVVPRNARLILGNELLAKFKPNYDGAQSYRQRQHTVGRVMAALGTPTYRAPLGVDQNIPLASPMDFFVGYIMLDAWIGNTDRHHENWGLILVSPPALHLAPTFDHASSLGRELSDEVRIERLTTRDKRRSVAAYIDRASSALYRSESEEDPLSTLDAFREVARWRPAAAQYWLGRLGRIPAADVQTIIDDVPPQFMTDPARQFARTILEQNKERLLLLAKALPK
jgi:hypothetical protein